MLQERYEYLSLLFGLLSLFTSTHRHVAVEVFLEALLERLLYSIVDFLELLVRNRVELSLRHRRHAPPHRPRPTELAPSC